MKNLCLRVFYFVSVGVLQAWQKLKKLLSNNFCLALKALIIVNKKPSIKCYNVVFKIKKKLQRIL